MVITWAEYSFLNIKAQSDKQQKILSAEIEKKLNSIN